MVEQRIYEGFPGRADEARMAAFHAATWPERTELVETFEDDRLRELGRRLVFLEAPGQMGPQRRNALETWLHNRRHGRDGVEAGRTLEDALAELNDVLARVDTQGDDVADIRRWLQDSV